MSTTIGVALFVIGVGALLISILMDRRPPSGRPVHGRPAEGVSTTQGQVPAALTADEPVVVPAVEAGGSEETVAPAPTVADAVPAPSDRAAAAEARLEALRAELAGGSVEHPATPEAPAATEVSARPDPGRVFAAVASVGRAPQDERTELATAAEPLPATAAPQPIESVPGHGHAIPIVNHSDLVSHLRREHPDLGSTGSTIEMRRLHDGAHAS